MSSFLATLFFFINITYIVHSHHCPTITDLRKFYGFSKRHETNLNSLLTLNTSDNEVNEAKKKAKEMIDEMNKIFQQHNGCKNRTKKNGPCTLPESEKKSVKSRAKTFKSNYVYFLTHLKAIFNKL